MPDLHHLPTARGSYVLHLCLAHSHTLVIGRLGQQHFPAGHYFYIGSAQGAGGLRARMGRHVRGAGVLHWHIDHLRAVAEVRTVFYTVTDRALECAWSQALRQLPEAFIPVPHFGASDCRSGCLAHLVAFPSYSDALNVLGLLSQATSTPVISLYFQ